MIRRLAICLIVLFVSLRSMAIDGIASHSVFFVADSTHGGKLRPEVDIYWQIRQNSLHYKTTAEKTIVARIKTHILLMNTSGVIREDEFIEQTVPRKTIQELMSHSIIDLRHYAITTGNIKLKLIFTDMADSLRPFTLTDSFTVPEPGTSPFFSDLELLDTSLAITTPSVFLKNGQQQVPACTNFLDENKNILHFYTELYNTSSVPADNYPLIRKIAILRKESDIPTSDYLIADTLHPGKITHVSGQFNIAGLGSGNYYLFACVENNVHVQLATKTYFFQRLNPNPWVDTSKKQTAFSDTGLENVNVLNLNKTFVAKYSLAEVRAILKMLLPVSDPMNTQNIKNFLKKPNDLYMRYFIYNHFAAINKSDPQAAWKEYSEKVIKVNKLFGADGYETDRGFIYLRYGPPTEVITVQSEPGSLPYEIWQYNTLTQTNHKDIANGLFLFYKTTDVDREYKLLHSNVAGEVENPAWRSYLYTSGQSGNIVSPRAEEYFGSK